MNRYLKLQPTMTLKRFTEQVLPTENGIDFYLGLVKHDVNQGYYVPMDVLKRMKTEPNYKQLETELFTYINDKNAGVNEKYEQDRMDDKHEIEVIKIGKK